MKHDFNFKELLVWQKAVAFAKVVIEAAENNFSERKHFRLLEQVESSVCSISMNIAEGKGRYSTKEFIHFLHIARGSLYETITLLNIFYLLNWISEEDLQKLESDGQEIGKMINGLITSIKKAND